PELVPKLCAHASAWCADTGRIRDAVSYAFAGNDIERAAELIEAHTVDAWRRGRFATLRELIERLPSDVLRDRPRLCVAYAYTLLMVGERAPIAECLHDAEAAVARASDTMDPEELAVRRAELAVLRADLLTNLSLGTCEARTQMYTSALAVLSPNHHLR